MGVADNDLVGRGPLARRAHPTSRRAVQLAITEAGQALAAQAQEALTRVDDQAVSALIPDERLPVHTLLARLLGIPNPDAVPPSRGPARAPPRRVALRSFQRSGQRAGWLHWSAPPAAAPAVSPPVTVPYAPWCSGSNGRRTRQSSSPSPVGSSRCTHWGHRLGSAVSRSLDQEATCLSGSPLRLTCVTHPLVRSCMGGPVCATCRTTPVAGIDVRPYE